jgi:hypothetical protein
MNLNRRVKIPHSPLKRGLGEFRRSKARQLFIGIKKPAGKINV